MMYFMHSDAVWSVHPELYALSIVAGNVLGMKDDPNRLEKLTPIIEKRLALKSESEMPEIAAWRQAFSKMGLKPTQYRCASEALLRRYRKEKSMPSFHPLIDYLNYLSMAFAIPIAAYDCQKISGGITVRPADSSEIYVTFQGETEHPDMNETIFADEENNAHSRRWTYRQSARSVVTAKSDGVLIIAEALHVDASQDLLSLQQEMEAGLSQAGVAIIGSKVLSRTERRLDF
jgi:DNA/RNA-binding domain of Phe-tRNA-synthetase-like protein